MNSKVKTTLIAVASAALISTSASAGNLTAPAQDNTVQIPVVDVEPAGSLGSLGGGSAGAVVPLLVLAALVAAAGSR